MACLCWEKCARLQERVAGCCSAVRSWRVKPSGLCTREASGQRSRDSRRRAVGAGRWALGGGRWEEGGKRRNRGRVWAASVWASEEKAGGGDR